MLRFLCSSTTAESKSSSSESLTNSNWFMVRFVEVKSAITFISVEYTAW